MCLHAAGLTRTATILGMLCGVMSACAWAGDPASLRPASDTKELVASGHPSEGPVQFNIPSQSLATALQRYAAVARRPAVFSSALVAGKQSSAILGRHTPEEALRLLLNGTGLIAHKGKSGPEEAFVLKRESPANGAAAADASGLDLHYGGWLQTQVWDALCADARTAPGDYRALLQFEVDEVGHIRRARLLTSTGDARRDAALRSTLAQVRVGRAPPPFMAQPLTMLLLPREAEHAHDGQPLCSQGTQVSRS